MSTVVAVVDGDGGGRWWCEGRSEEEEEVEEGGLVGEEAGEGLSQGADGLGLGLVVGGAAPPQSLAEGVGQGLGLTAGRESVHTPVSRVYETH